MKNDDPLEQRPKGLGKKPANTKKVRTGWCGFCRVAVKIHYVPGVGPLCPYCGGRALGNAPPIQRDIYQG